MMIYKVIFITKCLWGHLYHWAILQSGTATVFKNIKNLFEVHQLLIGTILSRPKACWLISRYTIWCIVTSIGSNQTLYDNVRFVLFYLMAVEWYMMQVWDLYYSICWQKPDTWWQHGIFVAACNGTEFPAPGH